MEELVVFSHIMSHDLKGPLTAIMGYSDLLKMELQEEAPKEEIIAHANAISKGAMAMNTLIADLLTYSKVSLAEQGVEEVDLNGVLSEVTAAMTFQIQERNVALDRGVLPCVQANPNLMRTVFYNLLSNAIKYQPRNLAGHQPRITVWAEGAKTSENEEGPREVHIFVKDNGIGISPEYLPNLFAPFQRDRSESYQGTGLGMAICKSIVMKYGGSITVAETGRRGTTFDLRFPTISRIPPPT